MCKLNGQLSPNPCDDPDQTYPFGSLSFKPFSFSYGSLMQTASRINLRGKVNDAMITGLRIVDALLPIGRGQRQLVLGDRHTGKTSVFLSSIISSLVYNVLCAIDGFGAKRL